MSENKKQESSDEAMNLCPQLSNLVNEVYNKVRACAQMRAGRLLRTDV